MILAQTTQTERRELDTRAGRDRLAAWLEIHPKGLAPLQRESVEALCALLDVAGHANTVGRQYRREVATLRQAAKRLRNLALLDPLTGLANRRALEERLHTEWDRASRYDRPLAVLMADLDDLKAINDTYGHPVGDALLQRVASIMQTSLRGGDLPGRMGGDEFVVICPETDHEACALVAAKLAWAVSEATVEAGGGEVRLRVSIGWAVASSAVSAADLMRRADEALYLAKARRREARD